MKKKIAAIVMKLLYLSLIRQGFSSNKLFLIKYIMINPRVVLNKIKWDQNHDLDKIEIWYIHRGAHNDTKIMVGSEIVDLGKSFIETTTSMIPYHRIFKIIYENKIIFNRLKKC